MYSIDLGLASIVSFRFVFFCFVFFCFVVKSNKEGKVREKYVEGEKKNDRKKEKVRGKSKKKAEFVVFRRRNES